MKKHNLPSIEELISRCKQEIDSGQKIAIVAGHYPLERDYTPGVTTEHSFGLFPELTFSLGLELVSYARSKGKEANIALLVDDHALQRDKEWYMKHDGSTDDIRQGIEQYFGEFELPPQYQTALQNSGFGEEVLIPSRHHDKVFQESAYREDFAQTTGLNPGCSGELQYILEDIENQGYDKVIAFIPMVCEGATCTAMDFYNRQENHKLKKVMAYLPTGAGDQTDLDWHIETFGINLRRA